MPIALIVMGVAGCGKSTFGRALAERLGYPFLEGDDYHPPANIDKMMHGVPLTDEDRRPWLDRLAALIAVHHAQGQSCVLACSALRQAYRDRLAFGGPVQFLWLKLTLEAARERLAHRERHFMPVTMAESQFATLEPPMGAIELDATLSQEDLLADALRQLRRAGITH